MYRVEVIHGPVQQVTPATQHQELLQKVPIVQTIRHRGQLLTAQLITDLLQHITEVQARVVLPEVTERPARLVQSIPVLLAEVPRQEAHTGVVVAALVGAADHPIQVAQVVDHVR